MVTKLGWWRRLIRQRCHECGQRLYKYAIFDWGRSQCLSVRCPDERTCLRHCHEAYEKRKEVEKAAVAEELAERAKREEG